MLPSIVTTSSGSFINARKRVLSAYRDWMRAAPEIVHMYRLDIPAPVVSSRVRQEFEKHRYIQDLSIIDVLLFKSRTEYEETMNYWKQKSHVMRMIEPLTAKRSDFLTEFYSQ